MQKIKDYIDRFFKGKKMNLNYALTAYDMIAFMSELQSTDGNGLFHAVNTLFKYGYVKGYRAAKAEMRKAVAS